MGLSLVRPCLCLARQNARHKASHSTKSEEALGSFSGKISEFPLFSRNPPLNVLWKLVPFCCHSDDSGFVSKVLLIYMVNVILRIEGWIAPLPNTLQTTRENKDDDDLNVYGLNKMEDNV